MKPWRIRRSLTGGWIILRLTRDPMVPSRAHRYQFLGWAMTWPEAIQYVDQQQHHQEVPA